MSPQNFYDRFKDRCYGLLFFFSFWLVLGCLCVPPVVDLLREYSGSRFLATMGAMVMVLLIGIVLRAVRRPRCRRWEYRPLSGDELNKARSKLLKCQNWKRT